MNYKEDYINAVKTIIEGFDTQLLQSPLTSNVIDSIDLVTIRVDFEKMYGKSIPDSKWLDFNTLDEIIRFCTNDSTEIKLDAALKTPDYKEKAFVLNMPQMAVEALSENWLFKELGDFHWELLCEGLNTQSSSLTDEIGNRLYATFVRISISFPVSLSEFGENDMFKMKGSISRYGNGMYFSEIVSTGNKGAIKANLMTSFSIRNNVDNTKLMKSQPAPGVNLIEEAKTFPLFGDDYRLVKKNAQKEVKNFGETFKVSDETLFTVDYNLNPYYDLNGVGLLYFAAYPVINDVCSSGFFTNLFGKRWETAYSTIARDIFYFANCNIDDTIEYRLNAYETLQNGNIKITSSIYRKTDNVLMARIFTIKKERK